MRSALLLMLLILTNPSVGQLHYAQVFDHTQVRDMKCFETHYLLHLDHLMSDSLKKYVINTDQISYGDALGRMDATFQYTWIYALENGSVCDFWEDEHSIYILNGRRNNSKTYSNAALYLLTLNKKGKLMRELKIDEASFDGPNGKFEARFDANGLIWKITDVPYGITAYPSHHFSVAQGKCYVIEALSLKLEKKSSYILDGKNLAFDAFDSKADEISFVFRADSARLDKRTFLHELEHSHDGPYSLLLQFNAKAEFTGHTSLAHGQCWIEDIQYQSDNLLIGASFGGNGTWSHTPVINFQGLHLYAPKSYTGDEFARNALIASLGKDLKVNWLHTFSGSCDILFNSLSSIDETIAVSFNYKDSVRVAGTTLYSLKKNSEYQYADPVVCFFNAKGDLVSHHQIPCHWSSWNKVFLFPKQLAVHGSFLYDLEVCEVSLRSVSKNSVYYLTIFEKQAFVNGKCEEGGVRKE